MKITEIAKTIKAIAQLAGIILLFPVNAQTDSQHSVWQSHAQAGLAAFEDCRHDDALKSFQAAMKIAETFGPNHPIMGSSLVTFAMLYAGQGRYGKAVSLYEEALGIYERTLEPDDKTIWWTMQKLIPLYYAEGRQVEADSLSNRARIVHLNDMLTESVSTNLENGPFATQGAWIHSALALTYIEQGRLGEAEASLDRAMEIYERVRGPDHIETAWGLNNQADLYRRQRRYDDAETAAKHALKIFEHWYGREHMGAIASLKILADVKYDEHHAAEARILYEHILASWEEEYERQISRIKYSIDLPRDPESPPVLESYPEMLNRIGQASKAIAAETRVQTTVIEQAKKNRAEHQLRCTQKTR